MEECECWKSLALIAAAAGWLRHRPATAQDPAADYPNKPVKIIVTVPAGGGVDTVTRIFAERLQQKLGQPFVIENRGGAGGNLGAEAVFVAPPDGYTLMASQPAPLTTNVALYKKLNFDPAAFEPVAVMSKFPERAAGAAGFPGQDRAGIHRLCEGQSGQAQLRLAGHRHDLAPDRRAVHVAHRHQDDACALPRHRAGAQRPRRRPCRPDLHGAVVGA